MNDNEITNINNLSVEHRDKCIIYSSRFRIIKYIIINLCMIVIYYKLTDRLSIKWTNLAYIWGVDVICILNI
jgi:hypothetical protein